MSDQNMHILESVVYVGPTSTVTVGLKQENKTKTVLVNIAKLEGSITIDLNSQELMLLMEALNYVKDKQTNARMYR